MHVTRANPPRACAALFERIRLISNMWCLPAQLPVTAGLGPIIFSQTPVTPSGTFPSLPPCIIRSSCARLILFFSSHFILPLGPPAQTPVSLVTQLKKPQSMSIYWQGWQVTTQGYPLIDASSEYSVLIKDLVCEFDMHPVFYSRVQRLQAGPETGDPIYRPLEAS